MYYFLVSDHGGSGRAVRLFPKIERILKERGIPYKCWKSPSGERAAEIVREVCASGDDDARLVVMGGDGTVNAVLNGITDFGALKLGLIPTGSGNDFARALGVTKRYRRTLEKILAADGTRTIDVGRVTAEDGTTRVFGISTGMGMDAIIGRKADEASYKHVLNKLRLGTLIYVFAAVSTLAHLKSTGVTVRVDGGEPFRLDDVFYLACMNCPTEGGGIPMAPGAACDDGLLTVGVARGVKGLMGFVLFPFICAGAQNRLRYFSTLTCRTLEIRCDEAQTCHYDGEALGENASLSVEILPQKLHILA